MENFTNHSVEKIISTFRRKKIIWFTCLLLFAIVMIVSLTFYIFSSVANVSANVSAIVLLSYGAMILILFFGMFTNVDRASFFKKNEEINLNSFISLLNSIKSLNYSGGKLLDLQVVLRYTVQMIESDQSFISEDTCFNSETQRKRELVYLLDYCFKNGLFGSSQEDFHKILGLLLDMYHQDLPMLAGNISEHLNKSEREKLTLSLPHFEIAKSSFVILSVSVVYIIKCIATAFITGSFIPIAYNLGIAVLSLIMIILYIFRYVFKSLDDERYGKYNNLVAVLATFLILVFDFF